jgi:hypothetical protein
MTSLLVVCTTVLVTQGEYLSHPPLRLNPPPSSRPLSKGPAFHVDAATGNDENDVCIDFADNRFGSNVTRSDATSTVGNTDHRAFVGVEYRNAIFATIAV